jgi:hypothetical protein
VETSADDDERLSEITTRINIQGVADNLAVLGSAANVT